MRNLRVAGVTTNDVDGHFDEVSDENDERKRLCFIKYNVLRNLMNINRELKLNGNRYYITYVK